MPISFYVAGHLTTFTGGESNLTLTTSPASVGEALEDLWDAYPGLRDRVVTEKGRVRPHVIVFIGTDDIRNLKRLDTPVDDSSEISILPAVSGGSLGSAGVLARHGSPSVPARHGSAGVLARHTLSSEFSIDTRHFRN